MYPRWGAQEVGNRESTNRDGEEKLQEKLTPVLLGKELGKERPNRTENLFGNTHATLAICQWKNLLDRAGGTLIPSLY